MNLALSTIGNIIRKYKMYGEGTANLPRNGKMSVLQGGLAEMRK